MSKWIELQSMYNSQNHGNSEVKTLPQTLANKIRGFVHLHQISSLKLFSFSLAIFFLLLLLCSEDLVPRHDRNPSTNKNICQQKEKQSPTSTNKYLSQSAKDKRFVISKTKRKKRSCPNEIPWFLRSFFLPNLFLRKP